MTGPYYIDPVDGNDTTGDGLGESTAWKTWAKVGSTDSWAAGETYYQKLGTTYKGAFILRNTTGTTDVGGAAGSPITITTKAGWGTGDYAIIDGENTRDEGINSWASSAHINISNFEIKNCGKQGVYLRNGADGTADNYCVIENCYIHDIDVADSAATCVQIYGVGATVLDCIFDNVGADGVYCNGDGLKVLNCRMSRLGQVAGAHGDGVQVVTNGANTLIEGNYIDHSDQEEKQCITVEVGTGVRVRRNTCLMPANTANSTNAIVVAGAGAVIEENYCSGAYFGILANANDQRVRSNIVVGATYGVVFGSGITGTQADNNTVVSCTYGFNTNVDDATSYIRNNILHSCTTGVRKHGNVVENYNCYYNCTTNQAHITGTAAWGANSLLNVNPLLQSDYSLGSGSPAKAAGTWLPGVRAYDDLPIPLHPDIGAVQDRTAPGRRFGVGGGTL